MELRGLEPLAFALPARRSSQLSYSPIECEVVCKVNACPLTVARRGEAEIDDRAISKRWTRDDEAAIELAAVDGEQVYLVSAVSLRR